MQVSYLCSHYFSAVTIELPYEWGVVFKCLRCGQILSFICPPESSCSSSYNQIRQRLLLLFFFLLYLILLNKKWAQTSVIKSEPKLSIFSEHSRFFFFSTYRKVGTPLSALMPAPERTTIFLAFEKNSLNAFMSPEGPPHPLFPSESEAIRTLL